MIRSHYMSGRVVENGSREADSGDIFRFSVVETEDMRFDCLKQRIAVPGIHPLGASVAFIIEVDEDQKIQKEQKRA